METIQFKSGDSNCVGDLFIPAGSSPSKRCPGIVIARGFSSVRTSNVEVGRYFERLGYVVLSIDFRTFGESHGEPRGQLFPLNQVEDYRSAVSYLQARVEVDPDLIGLWGPSFAGGIVIYAAAFDRRVKAVVAQAPIVDGRRWMKSLRTADQWEDLLVKLEHDRRRRFHVGLGERIKVTGRGSNGEFCAMPADEDFVNYFDKLRANPIWRDDITLESVERILEFNPASVIELISPRGLMIIATTGYDPMHPIDEVQRAYALAREPKELVLLPGDQVALYGDPGLSNALGHSVRWFDRFLRSDIPTPPIRTTA